MKNVLLIFAVLLSLQTAAQRYTTGKKDVFLTGFLIPFGAAGYGFYQHKSGLTETEINQLRSTSIPAIDRSAIHHYSLPAKRASDIFLYTTISAPALFLFDSKVRPDAGKAGLIYFQTMTLTAAEISLFKAFVKRPRPFVYNPDAPMSQKTDPDAAASFCSGHTAMTASASFFAANTYLRYHDANKVLVYSAAALIPLSTGYLRYRAGKHFPTDIAAGFLIGTVNAFIIDKIHR